MAWGMADSRKEAAGERSASFRERREADPYVEAAPRGKEIRELCGARAAGGKENADLCGPAPDPGKENWELCGTRAPAGKENWEL